MTSAYLPELFAPHDPTCRIIQDAATSQALLAVIKRLAEQRHSRLGHLHHTEFQLVLVRLDRLADKPGFEDLLNAVLMDWGIWYHTRERKLDTIAFRDVQGGKELLHVPDALR